MTDLLLLICTCTILFALFIVNLRITTLMDIVEVLEITPDEPVQYAEELDSSDDFIDLKNELGVSPEQLRQWEEERAKQRPSELTDYELARVEREAEFDLRISRMKEELASQLPDVHRTGYVADVLHPGIQNLPHDIIRDSYDDLPDVEITQ